MLKPLPTPSSELSSTLTRHFASSDNGQDEAVAHSYATAATDHLDEYYYDTELDEASLSSFCTISHSHIPTFIFSFPVTRSLENAIKALEIDLLTSIMSRSVTAAKCILFQSFKSLPHSRNTSKKADFDFNFASCLVRGSPSAKCNLSFRRENIDKILLPLLIVMIANIPDISLSRAFGF